MRETPTHASQVNPVLHLEQGRSHSQPVYSSAPAAFFDKRVGEDTVTESTSAVSKFSLPPLGATATTSPVFGAVLGDKHLPELYGVPGSDKSIGLEREVRDDADAASG